jgi:hypothetical protein
VSWSFTKKIVEKIFKVSRFSIFIYLFVWLFVLFLKNWKKKFKLKIFSRFFIETRRDEVKRRMAKGTQTDKETGVERKKKKNSSIHLQTLNTRSPKSHEQSV